jgi:hypothetical protein
MNHWIMNGRQMTDAEYEEHQKQQMEGRERVRREAEALIKKLGQTYDELTRLLGQNPEVARQVTDKSAADEEVYRKLRRNLERADCAPRCRWVKQDGTSCRSPQMRKHIYCHAHRQMMEARALVLQLPALEDANSIQIALMRVQKSLIDDTITTKKAGLLLYSLQLAMTNVGQTTFGQAKDEELVMETVDEREALSQETALSDQYSAFSPTPSTAKDAKGAKEDRPEAGLPLMSTDNTDRRSSRRMNADEHETAEQVPDVVPLRM